MSVYIKMKAVELTRTINEILPVVKFESEGGSKNASPTSLNDIEVLNATRQVQVGGKFDQVIESVSNCAKPYRHKLYTC